MSRSKLGKEQLEKCMLACLPPCKTAFGELHVAVEFSTCGTAENLVGHVSATAQARRRVGGIRDDGWPYSDDGLFVPE